MRGQRRLFDDDAEQPPALGLGQLPRLHDLYGVAQARLVVLVVNVANGPPTDVFAVALMLDQTRNLDAAGLVHFVAGNDARFQAPLASFACLSHCPSLPQLPSAVRPTRVRVE